MNIRGTTNLSPELLDDFFIEADEHLLNMRHSLLPFENSRGDAGIELETIGKLFHEFHSFKGISAIAGLGPAETLTHAAEDLLRLMRSGEVKPDQQLLGVLEEVVNKLEKIVAAFREDRSLPDCDALTAELKALCPGQSNVSPTPSPPPRKFSNEEAKAAQVGFSKEQLYKFIFSPTQKLNAQKINIDSIREELAKLGQIRSTKPVVIGKGKINFEFLIALNEVLVNREEWQKRGVSFEPFEQEVAETKSVLSGSFPGQEIHHTPFLAPSHMVRVDLKRLDELLRTVGEMVIHRSRLELHLEKLKSNTAKLDLGGVQEVNRMLGRSLRQMREDIMRIRLVPIAEIFARLPFVIRDLARETSKKVNLKILGQETSIDKYLIEKLKDPLLHMVRNAFSHGIEAAAERQAQSKPEMGTIELSASAVGDFVIINVSDDGKGIDADAIFTKARKLGLKVRHGAGNEAILDILCSPGFSSKDDADRMSGRGVGMSVVQSTINELCGSLSLESQPGRGTRFTLRLPLTVVIAETLLVTASGQICAVPQNSVQEIFHIQQSDIKKADGIEMVAYRGGVLPVKRLAGLFRLSSNFLGVACILVIKSERGSIGLLVEKVLGQREVVVRNFRDPLIQVAGISGATELGDGKPVLILDGVALTAGKVRPPDSHDFEPKSF